MTTGATPAVTFETLKPITDAVTGVITMNAIVGILAGALGVAVAFVLFWWGVRKVKKIITKATLKGKLSI